jgi:hypothetical protein
MYATVRRYDGNTQLADELAKRKDDIESLIMSIDGVRNYFLIRTDDGCVTITIGDGREATDESVRRAAGYLREHASELSGELSPTVSSGEVLVALTPTHV